MKILVTLVFLLLPKYLLVRNQWHLALAENSHRVKIYFIWVNGSIYLTGIKEGV